MLGRVTPYALVSQVVQPRAAAKAELVRLSRELERAALADPPPAVHATLQDARFLTERTRTSYARLAEQGAAIRLHARGLQAWVAPGVTGVDLDEDDPLVDEWCVLVTGVVALTATDLHVPVADDLDRTFRVAVSRDPEVVEACVRALG